MNRIRIAPTDHIPALVAAVQRLSEDARADVDEVLERCGVRGHSRVSLTRILYNGGGSVATAPVNAFTFWNN